MSDHKSFTPPEDAIREVTTWAWEIEGVFADLSEKEARKSVWHLITRLAPMLAPALVADAVAQKHEA